MPFCYFTAAQRTADCSGHQRHRATRQAASPCPRRATRPAATHAHGRLPPRLNSPATCRNSLSPHTRTAGCRPGISLASSCGRRHAACARPCMPPVRCLDGTVKRAVAATRAAAASVMAAGGGERDGGRWRLAPRRRRDGAPLSSLDLDGTIRWPALRSVHSVERRGEVVEQGIDNTGGVGF
ncbi:hypothetical protein GQ55_1G429800 [Panicum hallii var. hallii]|uniref:Uncharacterized protein n=1 Tax=Panicum hallii var. hallii TaxID=1504633 RepID=A0A2T7FDI1_9POAL|nr:hypothetical protein GQ55_1G429800 [Panicum hallii var. hallii]